jgi:4-hydroxy-tetrahydrodipicolinate reductase
MAIHVGIAGMGAIGRAATRLLLDHRPLAEIVGAGTQDAAYIGRRLNEASGARADSAVTIGADLESVLQAQPDIVILATGSFMDGVEDQVLACVGAGANVVSPCEELAFPLRSHTRGAGKRIDDAAREAGVTVLGTGVNPGFMFDSILAAATGTCWDVRQVFGRRVVDVIGFSQAIHRRLGIGYTRDEFDRGHAEGTIAGHVGFPESIGIVCERLGLELDYPAQERFEPMLADSPAPTSYGDLPVDHTEGFVQIATGTVSGQERFRLELILHLRPQRAGYEPADTIRIDGEHPVHLEFKPGMDAILATSAQVVNSIPTVLAASPGLVTITDLPDPAAWLGTTYDVPGINVRRTFSV